MDRGEGRQGGERTALREGGGAERLGGWRREREGRGTQRGLIGIR